MSSPTPINLGIFPNPDHISYKVIIAHVGSFTVQAFFQDGSKQDKLEVTWDLIDPDGTVFAHNVGGVNISEEVLARYRNPAGYSTRQWTFLLLSAKKADHTAVALDKVRCGAEITPAPVTSQSGPDIIRAQQIQLPAKQSHTFDIDINRVGTLEANVSLKSAVPLVTSKFEGTIQLFDPQHKLLASGTNQLSHPFTLKDLHAGHAPGSRWHLTVTQAATTTPQATECVVTAQVYDTLVLPPSVLQIRLDAILGDPKQGGAIKFRVNYDSKYKNIVYVKISEDLFFTLDNFGLLDTFETMRSTEFDGTVAKPAPKVPLDPGLAASDQWYPITTFDGGNEIHNLETAGIATVVGNGGNNKPTITLTAPIIHNPNGEITKLVKPWTSNWDPLKDPGASVEIKDATFRIALTIVPDGKGSLIFSSVVDLPVFTFNILHLPDWVSDVKKTLQSTVQTKVTTALGSDTFLPAIFRTLMGGEFTIRSAVWANNSFEFSYIPGIEEAPHQVSPYYSARGTVAPGTAPQWSSPNLEKIDHIVVLMMENRSFDHVLGHLSLTVSRSDIDGLTPAVIASFDPDVRPTPLTESRLPFDPDHSFHPVAIQMGKDTEGKGPMRGFVRSFLETYPFMATPGPQRKAGDGFKSGDDPYWLNARRSYEKNAVMRYHTDQTLPYYSFLAKEYMVCDRWYSSHPGPTLPNRFFYLMGHLSTDASGEPQPDNDQSSLQLIRGRTIQDALTERGISWKMYESPPDVCMLRMFARYAFDDTNIRPFNEFLSTARAGNLPSVSFLEPNFHMGENTNDDHPPCDMANGQRLLQSVHDALAANQNAWNKTLLIITYDEHGGLYDHHAPDLADHYSKVGQPAIDIHYGVRVPGLVISPWVPAGSSTHQIFDHTSILKTIVNRFCPNDPAIMSDRMAFANDLFPLLSLATPRSASAVKLSPSGPLQVLAETTMHAAPAMAGGVMAHASEAMSQAGGTMVMEAAADPLPPAAAQTTPVAARTMIADAKTLNAPVPRNSELFKGDVDWHQYMTRLGLMLK